MHVAVRRLNVRDDVWTQRGAVLRGDGNWWEMGGGGLGWDLGADAGMGGGRSALQNTSHRTVHKMQDVQVLWASFVFLLLSNPGAAIGSVGHLCAASIKSQGHDMTIMILITSHRDNNEPI